MIKFCILFAVVAAHTVIGLFGNTLVLCIHDDGKQMIEWAGALCCAAPSHEEKCCCEKKSVDDQQISAKDCCTDTPIISSSATLPSSPGLTISTWTIDYDAVDVSYGWSCNWGIANRNVINYTGPPKQHALLLLSTVVLLC